MPGIVGFARALQLCMDEMESEQRRVAELRQALFEGLASLSDVCLNGPGWTDLNVRLAGNLNMRFRGVEGESLMLSMPDVAVSSGSACTSVNPEPSHVLRALGMSDDETRSSLRFGVGRFNTQEEIEYVVTALSEAVDRLRAMNSSP